MNARQGGGAPSPFGRLVHHAARLHRMMRDGERATVRALAPPGEGPVPPRGLAPEALAYMDERVVPALAALERSMPLEKDPDAGVWEGLSLLLTREPGRRYVEISNALGNRERVTLHVAARKGRSHLDAWCACRTGTVAGASSWDRARPGRVVVATHEFGRRGVGLVDPGAVRLVEIALAMGATTRFSCEGHPRGAYLVFAGGGHLAAALAEAGWGVEPSISTDGGFAARMPEVASVDARDEAWRSVCDRLERILGLAPDAGREALRAMNLHTATTAL